MTVPPFVTLVVLCRNEAGFIEGCLDSLMRGTYAADRIEAVVVDGMSDDGTREILARYAAADPRVRIVDNPRRTTPVAFNLGIGAARGELVLPIGAHCVYQSTYVERLVHWMQESGADNVGGVCDTVAAADTPTAKAIAAAMSHPLAVGNSHFRIGITTPKWVDTVPFGCYRKSIFDRIGGFDEELVRNQDDELNHRLCAAGGRILLVPDVRTEYFARATFSKLAAMFWQYGYYKPLVVRKLGHIPTLRQLAPPALVMALVILGMLSFAFPLAGILLLCLVLIYGTAVTLAASSQMRLLGLRGVALLSLALPTIHGSYGVGWLQGALKFLILRRGAPAADAVRVTR